MGIFHGDLLVYRRASTLKNSRQKAGIQRLQSPVGEPHESTDPVANHFGEEVFFVKKALVVWREVMYNSETKQEDARF